MDFFLAEMVFQNSDGPHLERNKVFFKLKFRKGFQSKFGFAKSEIRLLSFKKTHSYSSCFMKPFITFMNMNISFDC